MPEKTEKLSVQRTLLDMKLGKHNLKLLKGRKMIVVKQNETKTFYIIQVSSSIVDQS